jgi:hypothetical protein
MPVKVRLLGKKEWRSDMRVKLAKPDRCYDIGKNNPAIGTKYECAGTIIKFNDRLCYVKWDNGYSNDYKDLELSLEDSPTGNCISIWD